MKSNEKKTNQRPAHRKVDIRDIQTFPSQFQFRHVEVDPAHVSDLAKALQGRATFEPLTLWHEPETDFLIVVDGHHRLEAYKLAGWKGKVSAVVHHCELAEARLMALKENGKTRLQLSAEERQDAAWRLVCHGDYSKVQIASVTGTSASSVARMRRTKTQLLECGEHEQLPRSWGAAMALLNGHQGREITDDERDAMIEAFAAKLDDIIGKTLGHAAVHQIEATAMVIEKRLGRRGMDYLIDQYGPCEFTYGPTYDENAPF